MAISSMGSMNPVPRINRQPTPQFRGWADKANEKAIQYVVMEANDSIGSMIRELAQGQGRKLGAAEKIVINACGSLPKAFGWEAGDAAVGTVAPMYGDAGMAGAYLVLIHNMNIVAKRYTNQKVGGRLFGLGLETIPGFIPVAGDIADVCVFTAYIYTTLRLKKLLKKAVEVQRAYYANPPQITGG